MTRNRIAALVLALPLVLAACGGGGGSEGETSDSGGGSSEVETTDGGDMGRDQIIEQLRQEAMDSGATTEELDCVMGALDGLDDAALMSILEDTASDEIQQQVAAAAAECVTQE